MCFCEKVIEPKFDAWLVPHSCGQTCGRKLKPDCGHACLLLCHPGKYACSLLCHPGKYVCSLLCHPGKYVCSFLCHPGKYV